MPVKFLLRFISMVFALAGPMGQGIAAVGPSFVVKGGSKAVECSYSKVTLAPSGQLDVQDAGCHSSVTASGTGLRFNAGTSSPVSCPFGSMALHANGLMAIYTDEGCIKPDGKTLDFDQDGLKDWDDPDPITVNLALVIREGAAENAKALVCHPLKVPFDTTGQARLQGIDGTCYGAIRGQTGTLAIVKSATESKSCQLVKMVENPTGDIEVYVAVGCIQSDIDSDGDGLLDKNDPDPMTPVVVDNSCPPGTVNKTISAITYTGTAQCIASGTITAGPAVGVGTAGAPAAVTYQAGVAIHLLPGFGVAAGSTFHASIVSVAPRPATEAKRVIAPATVTAMGGDSAIIAGARRLSGEALPDALLELLAGQPANDIAADDAERYLVFSTEAALDPLDRNGVRDIYLWDQRQAAATLVSRNADGEAGDGPSGQPRIDGGGSYIAYTSAADDVVQEDRNGATDIYLYGIDNGITVSVSMGDMGESSGEDARNPSIGTASPEIFFDRANANGYRRVYRYDADWPADGLRIESQDEAQDARAPAVSHDGRFLAYREAGAACGVVVRDRLQGVWTRTSCPPFDDGKEYIPFFNNEGTGLEWIESDSGGELLEGSETTPIPMENPLVP